MARKPQSCLSPTNLDREGKRIRRFQIIHNPVAGPRRRSRLAAAIAELKAHGAEVDVVETTRAGEGEQIARTADRSLDAVVAAGGDGTLNEVVNGLMRRPDGSPSLGVLPLGTANVLARELRLPFAAVPAARILASGMPSPIRIGQANDRYFTMMSGIGFDARIVAGLSPVLKRILGKAAYPLEAVRQLCRHHLPKYRVTIDGRAHEAAGVIVANGHFYGGGMILAADARITDPILHACLFERRERWRVLRYMVWTALGRVSRLPDFHVVAGRHLTVSGPIGDVDDMVQSDGDVATRLPVEFKLAESPINVILPTRAGGLA